MTVPWTGFPLASLVALASPLADAAFLRLETFYLPEIATGQKQFWYPWPYVEAMTIAEANHELAFVATGAYGKPLAAAMGAPIRVHLPWKYGFKSIKSFVRLTFTDERPLTFWERVAGDRRGFWANVNPDVAHPGWSQTVERDIATGDILPTRLFNGYAEFMGDLYAGLDEEVLFY
jgi:sulfoxide reductase catalytic subunit YedY